MTPCLAANPGSRREAPGSGIGGLDNIKTTPRFDFSINLDPSECAVRRIKRLRRSVYSAGRLHSVQSSIAAPDVPWFVTMTYADPDGWDSMHIARSLDRYRRFCKKYALPCRYVWIAEIQPKRAARTGKHVVHYHAIFWLPVGVTMPKWDVPTGRKGVQFWPHGLTNTQKARAGVGYLMKYLSKLGEFSIFPTGCRIFGIGGLNEQNKKTRSWINFPQWIQCSFGVGDIKRISGRFVVQAGRQLGQVLSSPYRVCVLPGLILVRTVGEIPTRFHDGAYSSYPLN